MVGRSSRRRRRNIRIAVGAIALLAVAGAVGIRSLTQPGTASTDGAPVLAGQQIWGSCAGGFYARLIDAVVLTSSGHCATEGTVAYASEGATVRGVFGPSALDPECPHERHRCFASDMNYLVVADDQIPWGRLNQIDLGTGGVQVIPAGTVPLACDDINPGDDIEINGRNIYRTGTVEEKGEYLRDNDGDFFPCMIAARIRVEVGDSGAGVFVRGMPGGVASRSFDGWLGFTPLAEGLAQLGLELCTTPNCDLTPPVTLHD
jgi:hypothetical protein